MNYAMDGRDILPKGRTRETKIRRDARGRWFNDDVEVTHANLVEAFDRWLERAPDGRYCLHNDINWAYVTIEGPARFVVAVAAGPDGVELRYRGGLREVLDPATLREGPDGALYAGRTLPARFTSAAAMGLLDFVEEDEAGPFLALAGEKVRVPQVEHPLEVPSEAVAVST